MASVHRRAEEGDARAMPELGRPSSIPGRSSTTRSDLFVDTPFWRELIEEFAADEREFVRRTAFAMMAWAAVHLKKEPDETFAGFLPLIEAHAGDGRNFVKKAVNWALRQIGKRSLALHGRRSSWRRSSRRRDDKTARWIGKDAVKELTDPKTLERLSSKR